MASKTAVAPLDRVKILLQAHNEHYKHNGKWNLELFFSSHLLMFLFSLSLSFSFFKGVFSGLKDIVQREKFSGLYRGNGAQMVRVFPYAAVQFFTFEIYKKVNNGNQIAY